MSQCAALFAQTFADGARHPTVGRALAPWLKGHFQIHFIYTGVSDTIFLIYPDGTSLLIDCGDHPAHKRGKYAVPILPGLEPVSTARQIELLPESFSIDIPRELTESVRKAGDDKEAVYRIGTDWCIAQCRDLLAHGIPAVHFYTMGKARNIVEILRACF